MRVKVVAAAAIYVIALAGAVGLGCAAPAFSCRLSPGASPSISVAMGVLAFFGTGLVLMGGVLAPAAMLLRRIGWLYWWSVLPIAAATALLPLTLVCSLIGVECSSGNFPPFFGALLFASLCGGLFLWRSWLRHQASERTIVERLAGQPPAVKIGLVFVGIYVLAVAAAAVFVATSSGDMSGMVLLYITLPWPLVGSWLFGDGGMAAGLLLGLALNAFIAFTIGYGLARALRRQS